MKRVLCICLTGLLCLAATPRAPQVVIVDGVKVTLGGPIKGHSRPAFDVQLTGFRAADTGNDFEKMAVVQGTLATPLAFKGMEVQITLQFYNRPKTGADSTYDYLIAFGQTFTTLVKVEPAGKTATWVFLIKQSDFSQYYSLVAEPVKSQIHR